MSLREGRTVASLPAVFSIIHLFLTGRRVIITGMSQQARKPADNKNTNREKEISAGAIVFRRTKEGPRFLVLYHRGAYWNFPKGKIEKEEKSFQAAVRETREETGLAAKDLKFAPNFKTREQFAFHRNKQKVFKVVIFYLAETKNPRIVISDRSHQGYGWFPYREASRILGKYEESQKVLKEANDFILGKGPGRNLKNPARPNPDVQGGGAPRRPA
jgi:8-oxo-dGTP pyrophosphatase MutT (NUDIX family)